MRKGDGLSQKDRLERITSVYPFDIIDNNILSLIHKAETIASFIRYYNFDNNPEGYWDELLAEIGEIRRHYEEAGSFPGPDMNMEPSQALLLTFIEQLQMLGRCFNDRWKEYPYWYLDEVLGVESQDPLPDRVWVRFNKNTPGAVCIAAGERFQTVAGEGEEPLIYKLKQDFEVQDLIVEQAFSVYFERKKYLYPASALNAVTSLKINDLIRGESGMDLMFDEAQNPLPAQSPGFMIASPSLLLREGKRSITITFEAENQPLTTFITGKVDQKQALFDFNSEESKYARLLEDIFYLRISTTEGWQVIRSYTTRYAEDCRDDIVLKINLPEDFPATVACESETHGFGSEYPVLKVLLNLDAWLYPYSWIKDFLLRRIRIRTCVEGVTNLLIYNELGQVDNSRPFQPFGLNTERGAWFAVGNYEMAVRPCLSINVRLRWGPLPEDEYGLKGYYREYNAGIDNRSFRVIPRFLTDYNWHISSGKSRYLFATVSAQKESIPAPDLPLVRETCWLGIPVDKMMRTDLPEDLYEYSIHSKTGFVSFVLNEPVIGFGEKRYRYIFTGQMLRNTWKKKRQDLLNLPLAPVIERITIDYESEEVIDFRTCSPHEQNSFYHVFPLGCKKVFPNRESRSVPLVYTLESDANVMFGLRHVEGGGFMRLYLDFIPVNKEIAEPEIPRIKWYYGDGYNWKSMPDSVIENNTTRNMLTDGYIDFCLPEEVDSFHSGQDGLLWLRAGITGFYDYIPVLSGIYTHAAELILEIENPENTRWYHFRKSGREIIPVRNIPGITHVDRISTFNGGREKETGLRKQIRVSEFVTHRGRAVIPRDYERITLQRFPFIDKVKCFPAIDTKQGRSGVVTLAVIPKKGRMTLPEWRPKASATLLLTIEEYLRRYVSAHVTDVDVINPEYEELMIRCRVSFRKNYSSGACSRRLKKACDNLIAPWLPERGTPSFDYSIRLQTVYETIRGQEYIRSVEELSVIRLAEKQEDYYTIHEYTGKDETVHPSRPYAIFVPAREHLFLTEKETSFGVNEMAIDETFVVE